MRNAVLQGVERYGDNFAIQVVEASCPEEGAGAEVDSTDERYTDWYQRTDEEGHPVDYDFESGEWADGFDPATGEMPAVRPDGP
jgi:hypothetical protein